MRRGATKIYFVVPFILQSVSFSVNRLFCLFWYFLVWYLCFRFRRYYSLCYEYICRVLFLLTLYQKKKHNELLCFSFGVLMCQKIICTRRKNSVCFMWQYQCSRRSMWYSNMNCHTIFLRYIAAFHRAQTVLTRHSTSAIPQLIAGRRRISRYPGAIGRIPPTYL